MIALVGCSSEKREFRVDNVVRVFWHEDTRYSVHVQQGSANEIEVQTYLVSCQERIVRIFTDVPAGSKMWLAGRHYSNWINGACFSYLEIHVHSTQDIEGGGWDHGKFGRGQTTVVE